MTGRIKRIKNYLKDETFCLSYGDSLSNVNIKKLIKFHVKNNKIATLTAVKYKNPKGILKINKISNCWDQRKTDRVYKWRFFCFIKQNFQIHKK